MQIRFLLILLFTMSLESNDFDVLPYTSDTSEYNNPYDDIELELIESKPINSSSDEVEEDPLNGIGDAYLNLEKRMDKFKKYNSMLPYAIKIIMKDIAKPIIYKIEKDRLSEKFGIEEADVINPVDEDIHLEVDHKRNEKSKLNQRDFIEESEE